MGRISRILGPDICYHVRCQCNNRAYRFSSGEDFSEYIAIVTTARKRFGFLLHAYVIMQTHVHLMITTPGPVLLSEIMYSVNQRYAVNFHRRHDRVGHFWMNRYRAAVVDSDGYALTCLRYIDLNPVRAGLVRSPAEWPWSTYARYARTMDFAGMDPLPTYLATGATPRQRARAYRDFVASHNQGDEQRERDTIRRDLMVFRSRRKSIELQQGGGPHTYSGAFPFRT